MKRVTKKKQPLIPIAALDRDTRRLVAAGLGVEHNTLEFASDSVIHWLNGFETIEHFLTQFDTSARKGVIDRFFAGKTDGCVPLDDHSLESKDRIVDLLDAVKCAPRLLAQQASEDAYLADALKDPDTCLGLTSITERMRKYATYPTLLLHTSTGAYIVAQQSIATNGYPHDRRTADASFTLPYGEVLAAHGVIEIARMGLLDRIRQCRCQKWFFGRSNRIFCDDLCRHKAWDETPDAKENRKNRAKKNRKLRKKGYGAFGRKKLAKG